MTVFHKCDAQGCGKQFSRSDHLARHKKGHLPHQLYPCSVNGCSKAFVRKDVRDKHEIRHQRKENREHNQTNRKKTVSIEQFAFRTHSDEPLDHGLLSAVLHEHDDKSLSSYEVQSTFNAERITGDEGLQLMPPDIGQWLWTADDIGTDYHVGPTGSSPTSTETSITKVLRDAFLHSPKFPHPNAQTIVDTQVVERLMDAIPGLGTIRFETQQVERALEIYWSYFHVQFPILHRPSFHPSDAHTFLLLSMVMTGAALSHCTDQDESLRIGNADTLVATIAYPLRWLICSSSEFCSPPKAYILQSLIILETCEMLCSNRQLHERAFLNHSVKIQLLRRSPLLGGDPLSKTNDDNKITNEPDAWKRWIEVESFNRVALVAFYLDMINATIFGHHAVLFPHQIKLLMPCDDMLWEMSTIDKNNLPPQTKPPKFITALTKVLHQENLEVGPLGKKILLAGLLGVKFQMELTDQHAKFLHWKFAKEFWKDALYNAIEVWHDDICRGDCCDSRNAFYLTNRYDRPIPGPFELADRRCKFSAYHIGQAFMGVEQYDCIIYAGATNRMNVQTTERDYEHAKNRIHEWAVSLRGPVSVLHSYIFLWELLFDRNGKNPYNPAVDPVFHRPNVVASSLMVVWAYNFSLYGPDVDEHPHHVESGYDYLERVCTTLLKLSGDRELSVRNISNYSKLLPEIPHTNRLAGLMAQFRDGFSASKSEICREYVGLLDRCVARTSGHIVTSIL